MSDSFFLSSGGAISDILTYLERQDESYFSKRGRIKREVLEDNDLIKKLASEHQKSVNDFGCEREWSCQDACDAEPGIWKGEQEE